MREPERPTTVPAAPLDRQLVWDLPLRVCHWTLALAVTGSFVTHYVGTSAFDAHVVCGYAVLVLVVFRVAWGWLGPAHARFADFVRGPRAVAASLLPARGSGRARLAGHTPLGGWMILLLLALLGGQTLLGLFANDEIANSGPLYGYVSHHLSNRLSRWHGWLANGLLIAVALHLAAACYYRFALGEDLVTPLFSGYKHGLPGAAAIPSQRIALALVIVAAAAAALAWVVRTAPEASVVLL